MRTVQEITGSLIGTMGIQTGSSSQPSQKLTWKPRQERSKPKCNSLQMALPKEFNPARSQEVAAMVGAGKSILDRFSKLQSPGWLSVVGVGGTGKTTVCQSVWAAMRSRADWSECDYQPHRIYWPKFADEMVEAMRSKSGISKLLELHRWPVLFLDDIGTGTVSDWQSRWAMEKLNALLGSRIGRWTILTSNMSHGDWTKVDMRMADRMVRHPNILIDITETTPFSME